MICCMIIGTGQRTFFFLHWPLPPPCWINIDELHIFFALKVSNLANEKKSLCLTKLKSKKIHHVSLTELSIGKKVHNFTHFGPPKILDTKFNVMFFNLRGNKFPFNLIPSHHRIYTYIDVLHDGKIVRSLLLQLIYLRSSSTMGLHLRAVAGRIGFLFAGHCSKAIR